MFFLFHILRQHRAVLQLFSNRIGTSTSGANSAVTAANSTAAGLTSASSPQPPPDLIGSLMLSSSGILDALLPSITTTSNAASGNASNSTTTGQQQRHRSNYSSNFLPTDFYRPLAGTLPRRRYSFGGVPDFAEQQISNLLNETSRSISRSMQILCENRDNMDLCEIKKALDIDPRIDLQRDVMNDTIDSNLLTMGTNFYSHPNIYTPPGGIYGSGQLKYQSPSAAATLFGPSPLSPSVPLQCQLATGSGPLFPSNAVTMDLVSSPTSMALAGAGIGSRRYKSNVNYLLSKPMYGHNATFPSFTQNLSGLHGNYYNSPMGTYPWNGAPANVIGNPLSLNQRLMAGLDGSYPSATMRNYHYGSHPTISKYSNTPRAYQNFQPGHLITSGINAGNSCYPPPYLQEASSASNYHHQFPVSSVSSCYNNYANQPSSFLTNNSYHNHQSPLYRHGAFQQPPRSLPLGYYPAYKVGSGGFYNATRHGPGGAFNANSLSRVGASSASAGDMKRQVSFKFDVDQLSIGS